MSSSPFLLVACCVCTGARVCVCTWYMCLVVHASMNMHFWTYTFCFGFIVCQSLSECGVCAALAVAPWGLVALGGGADVPNAVLAIDLPAGHIRVIKASQVRPLCRSIDPTGQRLHGLPGEGLWVPNHPVSVVTHAF